MCLGEHEAFHVPHEHSISTYCYTTTQLSTRQNSPCHTPECIFETSFSFPPAISNPTGFTPSSAKLWHNCLHRAPMRLRSNHIVDNARILNEFPPPPSINSQRGSIACVPNQMRKSRSPCSILSRFFSTNCRTLSLGIFGNSFWIKSLPTIRVTGDA